MHRKPNKFLFILNVLTDSALTVLCAAGDEDSQARLFRRPVARWTLQQRREISLRAALPSDTSKEKTMIIEYHYGEDKLERLPAWAEELVRLNTDEMIAPTMIEVRAAKARLRRSRSFSRMCPIQLAPGLSIVWRDPAEVSLDFSTINAVLTGKRLEIFKETVPKITRVAVLRDPKNPASADQRKKSQEPAQQLGLRLHSMEISSVEKYEIAFKEAVKARGGAVLVTGWTLGASNRTKIVEHAAKNRLPAILWRDTWTLGGLMSYGARRHRIRPARRDVCRTRYSKALSPPIFPWNNRRSLSS